MKRHLTICLAATECEPFLRVGGLADAVAGLAEGLTEGGDRVLIVLPYCGSTKVSPPSLRDTGIEFEIGVGGEADKGRFLEAGKLSGASVFLVENERYYGSRQGIYGERGSDYPDNLRRFVYYSEAVKLLLKSRGRGPDIIHCHNWQTGFISAYINFRRGESDIFSRTACVFTVHNLAFQGLFPGEMMPQTNLPWGIFNPEGIEFYGQINPTKAGIVCSHAITLTGREDRLKVFDEEGGFGLEGVLLKRRDDLFFIDCGFPGSDLSPSERWALWKKAAPDYRRVYLHAIKNIRS